MFPSDAAILAHRKVRRVRLEADAITTTAPINDLELSLHTDAQAMRLRDTEGQALRADHSHVAQQGGHAMRTLDFAPFYRSTVGFDRVFSTLDQLIGLDGSVPSYPPYNIERSGENAYRISVAVAGFTGGDLSIEAKENTLTIHGEKRTSDEEKVGEVLYQGIAARAFERVFQLADHVQVKNANLENGLLHVDLVREIPEAKKPRQIAIGNGKGKAQVETKAAA
jgi:molecular chaperone IbpA